MTQRFIGLLLIIMGLIFLLIVAGCTSGSAAPAHIAQPNNASPTLSSQAAALATIWAAPIHPVPTAVQVAAVEDEAQAEGEPQNESSAGALSDTALHGQDLFNSACSACHGLDAVGVAGLGPNLATSEFVDGLNDDELVQFVIRGRDPWDMENKTGIAMPSRGGNPAITDDDLYAIVAYLRSLD